MAVTYNAQKIVVVFGGVSISGYADGTFVEFVPNQALYSVVTGADGRFVRARNLDRTATLTISLLQSSQSNLYLSGLMQADAAADTGGLPLMVKDLRGETLIFSKEAWINTYPTVTYSKDIEARNWVLTLTDVDYILGGND